MDELKPPPPDPDEGVVHFELELTGLRVDLWKATLRARLDGLRVRFSRNGANRPAVPATATGAAGAVATIGALQAFPSQRVLVLVFSAVGVLTLTVASYLASRRAQRRRRRTGQH